MQEEEAGGGGGGGGGAISTLEGNGAKLSSLPLALSTLFLSFCSNLAREATYIFGINIFPILLQVTSCANYQNNFQCIFHLFSLSDSCQCKSCQDPHQSKNNQPIRPPKVTSPVFWSLPTPTLATRYPKKGNFLPLNGRKDRQDFSQSYPRH